MASDASSIVPVLLSGGTGSRLWPLSRETCPKQLLSLLDEKTLLQQTVLRVDDPTLFGQPIIIANAEHRFLIAEQLRAIDRDATIILEPVGRSTAPAVAIAALVALRNDPDAIILAMPVDHMIRDPLGFRRAVAAGLPAARAGQFVLFGSKAGPPGNGNGLHHCRRARRRDARRSPRRRIRGEAGPDDREAISRGWPLSVERRHIPAAGQALPR